MDAGEWAKVDVTNKQVQEKKEAAHEEEGVKCPRCHSRNTKFCYYNNYSLTQPRYLCKACKRYWTKGGSLRTVPVGGGSRKNKRSINIMMPPPPPPPKPIIHHHFSQPTQHHHHLAFSHLLKLPAAFPTTTASDHSFTTTDSDSITLGFPFHEDACWNHQHEFGWGL